MQRVAAGNEKAVLSRKYSWREIVIIVMLRLQSASLRPMIRALAEEADGIDKNGSEQHQHSLAGNMCWALVLPIFP